MAALPVAVRGGGQAPWLLMAAQRDGGSVVLQARESRANVEGTQRATSANAGMPGVAPVNTGALWPDLDQARARVLEIHVKLHQ